MGGYFWLKPLKFSHFRQVKKKNKIQMMVLGNPESKNNHPKRDGNFLSLVYDDIYCISYSLFN